MKKLSILLMFVCIIVSSIIFTGCGVDYSWYSSDGTQLTETTTENEFPNVPAGVAKVPIDGKIKFTFSITQGDTMPKAYSTNTQAIVSATNAVFWLSTNADGEKTESDIELLPTIKATTITQNTEDGYNNSQGKYVGSYYVFSYTNYTDSKDQLTININDSTIVSVQLEFEFDLLDSDNSSAKSSISPNTSYYLRWKDLYFEYLVNGTVGECSENDLTNNEAVTSESINGASDHCGPFTFVFVGDNTNLPHSGIFYNRNWAYGFLIMTLLAGLITVLSLLNNKQKIMVKIKK